jgi:hypothetical protein
MKLKYISNFDYIVDWYFKTLFWKIMLLSRL